MKLTPIFNSRLFFSFITLLTVLFLDIILPLDVDVDSLFILCLFMVMKESMKTILLFSLLLLLAFIIVFCVEIAHYKNFSQYLNRDISFFTIIIASILVIKYNRLQAAHIRATEERIKSLENIVFMTSHKIRLPVTNILGLVSLTEETLKTQEDNVMILQGLKDSAVSLDAFTRELASYLHDLKQIERSV